jgi:hypothetical protein
MDATIEQLEVNFKHVFKLDVTGNGVHVLVLWSLNLLVQCNVLLRLPQSRCLIINFTSRKGEKAMLGEGFPQDGVVIEMITLEAGGRGDRN